MAHKTYQYCVAENWGKGFITHNDSRKIGFTGFPGNVWKVPAHNQDANRWIAGVNGTYKTLSEAQAIVDAEVQATQAAWDLLPDDQKVEGSADYRPRPVNIILEEINHLQLVL